MSYKLTGTVVRIGNTETISDKFKKRELVVEVKEDKYPQFISLQTVNDRCDMLDAIGSGEQVEVSFNLKGREWTSPQGEVKYFNTLEAWRVESVSHSGQEPEQQPAPVETDKDDLPF